MMTAHLTDPENRAVKKRSQSMLLWIAMISMTMIFAGMLSAYLLRQTSGQWGYFELPEVFYYSTAALVTSSIFMFFAWTAIKKDNITGLVMGLAGTLFLGLAFAVLQFRGWQILVDEGVYFAGSGSASGSFVYVLTGLHLAHLAGGILALAVTLTKATRGKYSAADHHGVTLCATYWHFLDFLWLILFAFLVLIR